MKKQIVLYKGERFADKGSAQFAKDVVKVGRWVHPITKQEIVFTPERIEKLARNTEKFLAAGNRIPFPKGHTTDPTKNLGYWPGPFMPLGDSLIGVVEPKDPVALEAMKAGTLDAVSVCIEFDVTDAKENKYDEVITHVCATSYPVLDGQKGFVALSNEAPETHIPEALAGMVPEGDKAKEASMKTIALALGLAEAATESDIVKAALAARKAQDDLKAEQEITKGMKSSLAKAAGNKQYVLDLAKNLELPPALLGLAQEVLGVKGTLEALTLSTDGKGVDMKKLEDFPAKMRTLLDGIIKAKPVKGAPMQTLGTDRRKDDAGDATKTREQLAKDVVEIVQPEAAGKK